MSSVLTNILILATCWLLIAGAGSYVTFFQQPEEIERLESAEKLARMKHAEVATLMEEEKSASAMAEEALHRYMTRYREIPASLTSAQVIGALNDLTQRGFHRFDVSVSGVQRRPDHSYYTVNLEGQGYYSSLYRFIWDIENNPQMYRIRNLTLDHENVTKEEYNSDKQRMMVMVSFSMQLDAYFGAPDAGQELRQREDGSLLNLATLPAFVLPDRQPAVNPFFPLVMDDLPPNTDDRVDVDQAQVVALTDGKAVFQYNGEFRTLGVGDPVYLGRIIEVDAQNDRVVARLNRGGIIDEVELQLQTGERYRQALGPMQLAPTGQ